MRPCRPTSLPRAAFTFVEIMFVVIILGTLAAIVLPNVTRADDDARRSVFASNLKHFQQGLSLQASEGELSDMTDGSSGVCPPALAPYVDVDRFERPTPLGGVWDVEYEDSGVTLAVGVHFNDGVAYDDAYMTGLDRLVDDGDLATGSFRKLAVDRFYLVIRE